MWNVDDGVFWKSPPVPRRERTQGDKSQLAQWTDCLSGGPHLTGLPHLWLPMGWVPDLGELVAPFSIRSRKPCLEGERPRVRVHSHTPATQTVRKVTASDQLLGPTFVDLA